jgi:crotonobetainyl-CoA:carnitine CoA-transferase CaiB-like acyl-CoA transferase
MTLLGDVRVLDLGGFVTGPYTAMLLADLGADVVKIERPGMGDPFRALRQDLYSPQFQAHNRNKRSLVLDYARPEGREVLFELVRGADVFVLNNRPSVAEKLGIGYPALKALNGRIVYCSITGFGSDGPYAERPAFDNVGQALSGWMSRHRREGEARALGPAIADPVTGYYATIGILGALHERSRSGRGHLVEVNMLEATIALGTEAISNYLASGKSVPLYLRGANSQAYNLTCKDGRRIGIHLSTPDKFWQNLCAAIDRSDLASRYAARAERVTQYEAIAAELDGVFRTRTRDDWMARLEAADVPFAPEHEIEDLEHDPQVRHLGVFYEVKHPSHGRLRATHSPVRIDAARTVDPRPPPDLGEHSEEILREAGITPQRIAELRRIGVV